MLTSILEETAAYILRIEEQAEHGKSSIITGRGHTGTWDLGVD
jgi:hypothetical protein